MSKQVTKVLMFKQSSIGDCLMAKYFLENARAQSPTARFGIAIGSRSRMIRDLFAAYPWIEVVEVNRKNPLTLFKLWRRFGGASLVVTEYTGGRVGLGTKLVARVLAWRGRLIGFDDTWAPTKYLYTTLLPLDGRRVAPRLLEKQALDASGIPVTKEWLDYEYVPQPQVLPRLGVTKNNYVVVHLFSGAISRGMSPNRQQDLLNELTITFPNIPILLTGTDKERAELAKLQLPAQSKLVATSVQEIAELMNNASVVVSVGTGTSHMAASMRVPLAVFANCQGIQWVGPEQWGDAPIAAFSNPAACPNGHSYAGFAACIDSVDMKEVAKAAKNFVTMKQHEII